MEIVIKDIYVNTLVAIFVTVGAASMLYGLFLFAK